jgi:NAD-dependent dihydropyrimidine dehydrogenase PreA subunit
MSFFHVNERCNGCLSCVQNCPASALDYSDQENRRKLLHNMSLCARCGNCWRVCPQGAVEFKDLLKGEWDEVATMNLVRCTACGASLYSQELKESLAKKLDYQVETLCPEHRKTNELSVWRRLSPAKAVKGSSDYDYGKPETF